MTKQSLYFKEPDALLSQAIGIAHVLMAADPTNLPDHAISNSAWAIADMLSVIEELEEAKSDARMAEAALESVKTA